MNIPGTPPGMGLDAKDFFRNLRANYNELPPPMQMFVNAQVEEFQENNRAVLRTMYRALEERIQVPAVIFPQDMMCTMPPAYSLSVLWLIGSGENAIADRKLISTDLDLHLGDPRIQLREYNAAAIPKESQLEPHIVEFRWEGLNQALGRYNDFPIADWYQMMLK